MRGREVRVPGYIKRYWRVIFLFSLIEYAEMPRPSVFGGIESDLKGECQVVPISDHHQHLQFTILNDSGGIDFYNLWRRISIPPSRIPASYVIELGANNSLYSMKRELVDEHTRERVPAIFDRIQKVLRRQIDRMLVITSGGDSNSLRTKEVTLS